MNRHLITLAVGCTGFRARRNPHGRNSLRRAFSLVEVTLALGIVAFTMVPMMALIPVGLGSLRESRQQMVQAQIAQCVSGQLRQQPFQNLATYISGGPYYFDGAGTQLAVTNADTRYSVVLKKVAASYPGTGTLEDISASMTAVEVEVQLAPVSSVATSATYVFHIPNSGN